jgi:hypothetical protein
VGRAAVVVGLREGKRFFFEKKKQKTLLNWAVLVSAPQAQRSKSFLRRFFSKKRLLFFSYQTD